jgi:hypothetical protein
VEPTGSVQLPDIGEYVDCCCSKLHAHGCGRLLDSGRQVTDSALRTGMRYPITGLSLPRRVRRGYPYGSFCCLAVTCTVSPGHLAPLTYLEVLPASIAGSRSWHRTQHAQKPKSVTGRLRFGAPTILNICGGLCCKETGVETRRQALSEDGDVDSCTGRANRCIALLAKTVSTESAARSAVNCTGCLILGDESLVVDTCSMSLRVCGNMCT